MLDRVFVLMSSPVSLLLTRLFQLLLRFGIGEAEAELDAINLVGKIVEILDDLLGNITILESVEVSTEKHDSSLKATEQTQLPCKFLYQAHGRSWWK
jgi:hypothetical protein